MTFATALPRCSLAAGIEPKVISQMLGHATVAFTMDVYTEVAEELAEAAATAIAAFIPRRSQPGITS
jgi:site-specific recombinase XerD